MFKKIVSSVLLSSFILSVAGCATTHYVGDGVVTQSTPLHHFDIKPGQHTKHGVVKGITYGAVGGGALGAVVGASIGGAELGSLSATILGGLIGGAVGAVYYGVVGGLIGTTAGYMTDVAEKNYPHYEMKIQSIPSAKILVIKQYTTQIPLNTRVRIFEKNGTYFVKKSPSSRSALIQMSFKVSG